MLDDKISIKDLATALKVKSIASAMRWCNRKGISILKFGKDRYINLIDFQLAIDRPFIESLKLKYPEKWKQMYEAYKNNDYITIAEIESSQIPKLKPKFVAPGKAGNDFLKKIQDKTKNK